MNFPLAIIRVASRRSSRRYYVGVPQADVDYATDGLLILTSRDKNEIVLCMATDEEYHLGPENGVRRCAIRLEKRLIRTDLSPVISQMMEPAHQRIWTGGDNSPWSFAFVDIFEDGDYADPESQISIDDFIKNGGLITDLRNE